MINKKHIINLIETGEGQHLDFKFEISDAAKIARSFVAFANSGGGTLLIGVKDNGEIAGIRSEEERFMAKKASSEYCDPPVEYSSKEWKFNHKVILQIKIPEGRQKPYFALTSESKWLMYIRVDDENILANRILVSGLKRRNSNDGTYITYTTTDKILLEYLEEHPHISFSEFKELANLSSSKADKILINFIALGIIDVKYIEKEFLYCLSDKFRSEY